MIPSDGTFHVLLQFLRAQDAGDPLAFRFEPQEYILPTAGGDSPTARFEWTAEVLADLQAVRLPGRDPAVVQRVGERLRRFVLPAGWAQHEQEIIQVLSQRRLVVLTIRSSAAELYALPWELLALKSGQLLGELDGLLLRFEWPESESKKELPQPRPEGGRVLLAWSAAGGPVPAAEHGQAIAAACAAGFHPFDPATDVLPQASLERIVKALQEAQQAGRPIAVLHLLAHGGAAGSTYGLCLDSAAGPVVVDAMQLRQQLAPFASMVRLVVLAACDSGNTGATGNQLGSVAQALHRSGFAAVVASRFPLSVAGSVALTQSLYGELLAGPSSLEAALLAARQRLWRDEAGLPSQRRSLDWASVQLYARQADGNDTRPVVFRPYRGLLAFQPEHQRFFFGHDRDIGEVLADLQALSEHQKARLLVVAGASGTGKSSLVLAGAVPRLQKLDPRLRFLRMRPGSDPERALNDALAGWPDGTAALLVVDQFEELFTQTEQPAARQAFARRLWSLASAPEPGLRVIITLRVDFIGRCGELSLNDANLRLDRVAYDEAHRVFLSLPAPAQLRAGIVEPARLVGLELQAGLPDRLLEDVGNEPGALPLLEDVLDVLWQQRDGRLLTQAAYDRLGGVVGALQRRADGIIGKLARDELGIAQRLLVSLVAVADDTTLDTRLRVTFADLQKACLEEPDVAAGFERVLKGLVAARLLVQDGDGQAAQVEVAHEALIRKWPRLRAWLDEDRAGLIMQRRVRQAAQQWVAQSHDESLLYRGAQLGQAGEWRKAWAARLGSLEQRFLDESEALRARQQQQEAERQRREKEAAERLAQEQQQKEQLKLAAAQTLARRTRWAALALAIAFLFTFAAAREARRQSEEAHDELLVAVARNQADDPTTMATLLREVEHTGSIQWQQTAVDTLAAVVAEGVLRGHQGMVLAAAYSPDGKRLATASEDHTIRIWNVDGSGAPMVLSGHQDSVDALAYSLDGRRLVSGSSDQTACIWNADGSGSPVVLKGHEGEVFAVAFSPDGKKVLTGSRDQSARLWNADGSGTPVVLKAQAEVYAVGFRPDGGQLLVGSMNDSQLWNADGSGVPVAPRAYPGPVTALAFHPDGKRVLTASGEHDSTPRIFSLADAARPLELGVIEVEEAPDGPEETGQPGQAEPPKLCKHRDQREHKGDIYAVAFSRDGQKALTGSQDHTARLWEVSGLGDPVVLKGHASAVSAVAFRPDGKQLCTGSWDRTARLWNVTTLHPVCTSPKPPPAPPLPELLAKRLPRPLPASNAFAYSPDKKKVVIGTEQGSAQIWNADGTGQPVELKRRTTAVTAVAYSGDGRKLATGARDGLVQLWNADGTGQPVELKGPPSQVTALGLSADGSRVVSGDTNGGVRVFRSDGKDPPLVLPGERHQIALAAFRPDGKTVLVADWDPLVCSWVVDGDELLDALWKVTSDCLPPERRRELLSELPDRAEKAYHLCRQEVARRRGWSAPAP